MCVVAKVMTRIFNKPSTCVVAMPMPNFFLQGQTIKLCLNKDIIERLYDKIGQRSVNEGANEQCDMLLHDDCIIFFQV